MNIRIVAVKRSIAVNFSSELLEKNFKNAQKKYKKEKRKNTYIYMAKHQNIVIGFLYAHLISRSGDLSFPSIVTLDVIIVESKYQNHGIATGLLESFLDICYNNNMKIIDTERLHELPSMEHLFQKLEMRRYCYDIRLGFKGINV